MGTTETMENLSLYMLDIAENAILAGARWVEIHVAELRGEDSVRVDISFADPPGGAAVEEGGKAGMGYQRLIGAACRTGGEGFAEWFPGDRCRIRIHFGLTHPERPPLGNVREAFQTLSESHPEIDLRLEYTTEDATQTWDTATAGSLEEARLPTRTQDGGRSAE